jgi:hypothetical protein
MVRIFLELWPFQERICIWSKCQISALILSRSHDHAQNVVLILNSHKASALCNIEVMKPPALVFKSKFCVIMLSRSHERTLRTRI